MNHNESLIAADVSESKPWVTEAEIQEILSSLRTLDGGEVAAVAAVLTLITLGLYKALKLLVQGSNEKGD